LFGDRYQLTSDQNTKNRFENDKTGYRLSTSVGGSGTGEGGDVLVVDDPQNASEAYSEAKVMATQEWWDNTMSTRGNNPKTVAKVIVMQRLAENDLSGHVIKQGGYEHLMLPMEFESDRKVITSIGWEDPRTEEGELLWPERFDPASIKELKTRLGTYGFAGQMQQRPAPKGGGMFKRAWFEVVRAAPSKFVRVVRYWDRAATEDKPGKDPDYTVGVKMGKDIDGVHYVLDVCRMRESSLKVQTAIKNAATQDGFLCKIGLEQDPGQAGKSEVEYLIRQLAGFNVKAYLVQHNKTTRASPLSAQAEAGNIKLVEGPWNEAFLKELETFPLGDHDDQVDSASGSFNMLNEAGINYEGLTKL
jgi:predicted phage terminase large subunit-like protein